MTSTNNDEESFCGALIEEWIADVYALLIPRIQCNNQFVESSRIIDRFNKSERVWRRNNNIRQLINFANELAVANELLKIIGPNDEIYYEPRLQSTNKTIDFLVRAQDGSRGWYDVKTIAPKWDDGDDKWAKYLNFLCKCSSSAHFIVEKDLCGAAIYNQMINARWSVIKYTIEAERKALLLSEQESGPVRLVFCSAGEWHHSNLEDFSDFYRTGSFRGDDCAQVAVKRRMEVDNLSFRRVLSGFCYLERRHHEVEASCFRIDVKGPKMFAPSHS